MPAPVELVKLDDFWEHATLLNPSPGKHAAAILCVVDSEKQVKLVTEQWSNNATRDFYIDGLTCKKGHPHHSFQRDLDKYDPKAVCRSLKQAVVRVLSSYESRLWREECHSVKTLLTATILSLRTIQATQTAECEGQISN